MVDKGADLKHCTVPSQKRTWTSWELKFPPASRRPEIIAYLSLLRSPPLSKVFLAIKVALRPGGPSSLLVPTCPQGRAYPPSKPASAPKISASLPFISLGHCTSIQALVTLHCDSVTLHCDFFISSKLGTLCPAHSSFTWLLAGWLVA